MSFPTSLPNGASGAVVCYSGFNLPGIFVSFVVSPKRKYSMLMFQGQATRVKTQLEIDFSECLKLADKDSEQWQEAAGRFVGLAYTRASQAAISLEEFLSLGALILAAQISGSKQAKKRLLSLTRLKSEFPFDYSFPEDEDEALCQLRLLTRVQSSWCNNFIKQRVEEGSISEKAVDLYFIWAANNSESVADTFSSCVVPILQSQCDEKFKLNVLKAASAFADTHASHDELKITRAFESLVQEVLAVGKDRDLSPKVQAVLLNVIIKFSRRIVANSPCVLLRPDFLYSLRKISGLPIEKLQKTWNDEVDFFTKVVLSILQSTVLAQSHSSHESIKVLLPILTEVLPNFARLLEKGAEQNRFLRVLTEPNASGDAPDTTFPFEDPIAQLLTRWARCWGAGEISQHDLNALNQDIQRLSESLRIRYIGSPGLILNFDPREHVFIAGVNHLVGQVKVIEPGVCQIRDDGSERVIIHAIVTPARE